MADDELEVEEEDGGKKKKMMLVVIVIAVLVVAGGAAFFLMGDNDEPAPEEQVSESDSASAAPDANRGSALYVAMPRPFVFNVLGSGRDRLVQIKVQLMVRGSKNEEWAKMHIPMIEGTLLTVFSKSSADDLVTELGKITVKEQALREVQKSFQGIAGQNVVEQVLFTGFVMQ